MNYTTLFYWLTVADNAKTFFQICAIFFSIVFIFTQICRFVTFMEDTGNDRKLINKWTWYSTPFMIIFISLWLFTPSKKDALLIVTGGQTLNFLTTDSSAKQIPSELSHFLVTEIKNLAKDAEVELDIRDQKQKVLDEVKTLSAEELLNRMKSDTTLKNLILE